MTNPVHVRNRGCHDHRTDRDQSCEQRAAANTPRRALRPEGGSQKPTAVGPMAKVPWPSGPPVCTMHPDTGGGTSVIEATNRRDVPAMGMALWRLVVAGTMAALAAFFAAWSGGMAAEALDPYDSTWHVYAMVAVITATLSALSIAVATSCRSRRAVTGLVLYCVGAWLLWAACAGSFDSFSVAPRLLLVGTVTGAPTLLAALALPSLLDADGR